MSTFPNPLLRIRVSDESHRVTTFELFFDLVFVFAFTQVTAFMAESHSAMGILQAMIILGLLWLSWVSYSWLSNQAHVDEGVMRVGMSVAMTAMFVVALVIPEAFEDLAGGLDGPFVLAISYLIVRVAHILLYLLAAGDDSGLRRQVMRTSLAMVVGSGLIIVGAIVGGEAQTWIWLAGLGADIVLTYLTSAGGDWRIHSAAHWSERYGLVVILALGESIVAIGVGAAQLPVSTAILTASVLGIALSIFLWWLYFDVIAIAAEHVLTSLRGNSRARLAVDAYTYIHLLLIAGIVISALGVEDVVAHAEDGKGLGYFGAFALLGGTALYLAGHSAFWKRVGGNWKIWRLGVATFLLAAIPLAAMLPPLAALALVVLSCGALVGVERVRYVEQRSAVRDGH